MSSVTRALAARKEGLTQFLKSDSPNYLNGSFYYLFPFTCENQTLDITYAGNNFKARMVDNINREPDESGEESETVVRVMSGPRLVTALGENFKAYVRSWLSGSIDSGSPIEVYLPCQVLRVQEAAVTSISSDSDSVFKIGNSPPTGDNYIGGSAQNNYQATYIFKTPLTFTVVDGGVTKYITFKSTLEQE